MTSSSRRSVNWNVLGIGFVVSIVVCILTTDKVFGAKIPWAYVLLAIVLSLPMGVVGIRSLGELDYNPQSGLSKDQFFLPCYCLITLDSCTLHGYVKANM